jgi:hypothetical protein
MAVKYSHKIYPHFPFEGPPKIPFLVFSGMKINHLATLIVPLFPVCSKNLPSKIHLISDFSVPVQGCQISLLYMIPKPEEMYKMNTKCTKLS